MGIINSLGEIKKNSSSFKQWETEQDNVDSKREELGKKRPPSQEELKNAAKLGETIMDVVDIMDQHSEDIAENVETATTLPKETLPGLSFLASFLGGYKLFVSPAVKEEIKLREKFFETNDEKIKELIKKFKDENPQQNSSLTEWDILYKRNIKKVCASDNLKREAEVFIKSLAKIEKKPLMRGGVTLAASILAGIAAFIAGNVFATKMQVGSSKVARFQARKVLEDPKYFVSYTPEQIEKAKKNVDANKDKKGKKKNKLKTDKLKGGMFGGIASILKDNKAYRKWKNSDESNPEKIERPLTQEELETAQKDREVIQRVVKKINNKAEVYSENMEVAANVLIGGTPILGAAVGLVVSGIINLTKIMPNIVQKMVNKYGDDSAKKAYEFLINAPKEAPNKRSLFKDFAGKMLDSEINKGVELSKFNQLKAEAKKLATIALSTKMGRNFAFGIIGGFFTSLAGLYIGLKLQKSSARAGRYVAKRELEKNPQNFVGYSDKELSEVQNAPAKPKTNKLKEIILFIPNVIKQYYSYEKYKKNKLNPDKILKEELTKLDVTDEQLKDAKNLQRKIFNTFEQVDDKSQEYSESVEAACEIAKPFVLFGGILTLISPAIVVGIQALRGKINVKSIIDKVTSFLGKSSDILKKKFLKNYLNDVAKKVPCAVQNTDIPYYVKNPSKYDKYMLEEFTKNKNKIGRFIEDLKSGTTDLTKGKAKISTFLKETVESIEKMPDDEFEKLLPEIFEDFSDTPILKNLEIASLDNSYIKKVLGNLQKIIDNIPEEEIKNIINKVITEYEKNPDQFTAMLSNGDIKTLASIFITKKLGITLGAIGGSWIALNIAIIFIIESWLADMQLKAGRLGVMKALESLKDPAYYANSETVDNTKEDKKNLNTPNAA